MPNFVVAFDLDGVLLDFESAWRQCAEWHLGRYLPLLCEDYPLTDRFGLSHQEVDRVWDVFHRENWWERVPLYEDVWPTLERLENLGCTLWAVTNVDAQHHRARAISLEGVIPSGRIVTLGSKASPEDRVAVLRDIGAAVLVDDRSDNVNAALPYVSAAVLMHRGYRGLPEPEHGVTVIDDLRDLPAVLENALVVAA